MILVEPYVKFLVKHDLTQEQLLFLLLVYTKRIDLIELYKKKFSDNNQMISNYLINDLIEKDFLIVTHSGYKLGIPFLDIFVDADIAVDELYKYYPDFYINNNGVSIPLLGWDRNICKNIYIPKIMGNLKEHREILKDIEFGIKHKLLNIGINKFITSEFWKVLRKKRLENINIKAHLDLADEDF